MGHFPYPNDGTEKPARPARAAARLFASRHMLSHFVFLWGMGPCPMFAQALEHSCPNGRVAELAISPPFRRAKAPAFMFAVHRFIYGRWAGVVFLFVWPCKICLPPGLLSRTRMTEQKNLSTLHASLPARLPAGACFLILSFHGGMGLCPMFTQALDLSCPNSKAAESAFPARAAGTSLPRG